MRLKTLYQPRPIERSEGVLWKIDEGGFLPKSFLLFRQLVFESKQRHLNIPKARSQHIAFFYFLEVFFQKIFKGCLEFHPQEACWPLLRPFSGHQE